MRRLVGKGRGDSARDRLLQEWLSARTQKDKDKILRQWIELYPESPLVR